jgi:HSP20 family protein
MTITAYPSGRLTPSEWRRWDPFREFDRMFRQMSRLMDVMPADRVAAITSADTEETDDAYMIELDLPGVKAEDLNIEVEGADLRITGEIKERERVGIMRRRERPVGRFEHVITLPREVNAENMEARLSDGVPGIRVPKMRAAQPRRIEVKKGD